MPSPTVHPPQGACTQHHCPAPKALQATMSSTGQEGMSNSCSLFNNEVSQKSPQGYLVIPWLLYHMSMPNVGKRRGTTMAI